MLVCRASLFLCFTFILIAHYTCNDLSIEGVLSNNSGIDARCLFQYVPVKPWEAGQPLPRRQTSTSFQNNKWLKKYNDILSITFLLPNTKLTQEHKYHYKLLLQQAKPSQEYQLAIWEKDKTVNLKYFTLPLDSKFPSQNFFFRVAHPFLSTFSLAMLKVEEKPSKANSQ